MTAPPRSRVRLFSCLGIGLGLAAVLLLAAAGLTWNARVYRHMRAARTWSLREPPHYLYTVQVHTGFWTSRLQIEVLQGVIMGTVDLDTGKKANFLTMVPGSYLHETSTLWGYLIIDNIFEKVQLANKPPRTWKSFVARLNPDLYYKAAMADWVEYGWMGCESAYPQVVYNRQYGYPEWVQLSGSDCNTIMELNTPISIRIESFKVLP